MEPESFTFCHSLNPTLELIISKFNSLQTLILTLNYPAVCLCLVYKNRLFRSESASQIIYIFLSIYVTRLNHIMVF